MTDRSVQVPHKVVAVVMQRRTIDNRWQSEVWEPHGVLLDIEDGEARLLVDEDRTTQWIHPGMHLTLHRSESEGYFHNVSSERPCVFVRWEMDGERAVPELVTLSYDEASRWMDGGAQVDRVPMPPELFAWVGAYVEEHYRPEKKQRIRPQSFKRPRDRV